MNVEDLTISDMSLACLFIIVIYSLFAIKKSNLWSVLIFSGAALIFWIPLGWIPYEELDLYFLSAAVIDLTVLEIISLFKHSRFATNLKGVCLAFISLDLISWLAWKFTEFDYTTEIYNYICFALYLCVLIMITKEKADVRNNAKHSDHYNGRYLPVDYNQGNISVRSCEKKSRA